MLLLYILLGIKPASWVACGRVWSEPTVISRIVANTERAFLSPFTKESRVAATIDVAIIFCSPNQVKRHPQGGERTERDSFMIFGLLEEPQAWWLMRVPGPKWVGGTTHTYLDGVIL